MSDEASGGVAAPEGATAAEPTPVEQPQAPEQQEQSQQPALTRREAREQMRERARQGEESLRSRQDARKEAEEEPAARNEKGQFVGEEGSEGGEEAAPEPEEETAGEAGGEGEADPEGRSSDAGPDAEADESDRSSGITVELAEDHPLREMGKGAIKVLDPDSEQMVRALLNGVYTRRQEVEEMKEALRETKRQLVRKESNQTAMQKLQGTDEYREIVKEFEDIKEMVGPEAASRFWKGQQSSFQQIIEQEFDEKWGEVEAKEAEAAGQGWVEDAWGRAARLPQEVRAVPSFPKLFEQAVVAFNAQVEAGAHEDVTTAEAMHQRFAQSFVQTLMARPEYRQVYAKRNHEARQKKEPELSREEIERQAIERFKKEQSEKRGKAPPHPMGRVGSIGGDRPGSGDSGESEVPSDVSTTDVRKMARQGARTLARARFTP